MGAASIYHTMPAEKTQAEVREWFNEARQQAAYEDGNSYSGNWNMLQGLTFAGLEFGDDQGAVEWLEEHMEKSGNAVAVRAMERKPAKATYPDQAYPVMDGGGVVARIWNKGDQRIVACDQLTEAEKKRALAAYPELEYMHIARTRAEIKLQDLAHIATDVEADLPGDYLTQVKMARREVVATRKTYAAAEAKLKPIQNALQARLDKAGTHRRVWVIGGLAAC